MASLLAVSTIPNLQTIKDDPILDLLQREYAILQDKIDKIGGFRFTIKGWALTLNTGALVAAFATALDPLIGTLLLFGMVFGLWLLELRQANLTEIFQSRALRIEVRIMRRLSSFGIRRSDFATLISCPGIASELRSPVDAHRPDMRATSALRRRKGFWGWLRKLTPFAKWRKSKLKRQLSASDALFYLLLWAVSVAFIWFQQNHMTQNPSERHSQHFFRECSVAKAVSNKTVEGVIWPVARK